MERLLSAAAERAMKIQEVILRAMAKKITIFAPSHPNQEIFLWGRKTERNDHKKHKEGLKKHKNSLRVPFVPFESSLVLFVALPLSLGKAAAVLYSPFCT
jgi:hypothetical protein